MFTDAAMGASGGASAGPAKSLDEHFPKPAASEKFDWTVVAAEPWFRRQVREHPLKAGELASALIGQETDAIRLQMYFVEAIGPQAMKAMGEAYDGFKNGGKPPTSGSTRDTALAGVELAVARVNAACAQSVEVLRCTAVALSLGGAAILLVPQREFQ
jgi:hypothetical protein